MYIDTGKFLKTEVVFLKHEYRTVAGRQIPQLQPDARSQIGHQLRTHVRSEDVKLPLVVDAQQIRTFSVGQAGVFGAGIQDEFEGEKLFLFIASKNKKLDEIIRKKIMSVFGSFAIPSKIFYVSELPKTRSGKILRRLLRSILIKPDSINDSDLNVMADKNTFSKIIKEVKGYE